MIYFFIIFIVCVFFLGLLDFIGKWWWLLNVIVGIWILVLKIVLINLSCFFFDYFKCVKCLFDLLMDNFIKLNFNFLVNCRCFN